MSQRFKKIKSNWSTGFKIFKNEMIDFTISTLSALITRGWRDETVTAVVGIVETLTKIASLPDIQDFIVLIDKHIHASDFISFNRKSTESPLAIFQELFVFSVLVTSLRIEFQRTPLFVSFGN